jgi:hypothetical protein
MRCSLLIVPLVLGGCELEMLPTEVGEHVVYHWDADASQLCGGTVAALDRHVELMTGHYGWPASERRVEYFWDAELARSVCSRFDRPACARRFSAWTMVLSPAPLDTHELGHVTRVGSPNHLIRGYVNFISEGFATRWQSSTLEPTNVPMTSPTFLSEVELRAALETDDSKDFRYAQALTWWLALELGYGPAKMAEFVAELEGATSADGVEAALQRVFDISLAESAALAEELPSGSIDDPACALEGLPTFTWTGGVLVVERDHPSCEDEDIVNASGRTVIWPFALEFPDTPTRVEISVTVADGENPLTKSMHLFWCSGEYHLAAHPPTLAAGVGPPGTHTGPWRLWGRFVGVLRGPLEADGSVAFPRVIYKEASP